MVSAKAIDLSVRPTQSADLCYPLSGIIEYLPEDLLGRTVQSFGLREFQDELRPEVSLPSPYDLLAVLGTGQATPKPSAVASAIAMSQPIGDGADQIDTSLSRIALSRLRAADIAAGLTQALSWYALKNGADLTDEAVKKRTELIGRNANDPNSLLKLLDRLSEVLSKRHDRIATLYQELGPGEVLAPESISTSKSTTTGGQSFNTTAEITTRYIGHEYQIPPADNRARYLRSEIALRQERLAAYRLVSLNTHENVLFQRAMTASEVRKIQLAYVDTFLMAPFDGVITAVFHNVGDFVAVGQPVVRLENDRTVFLVGTIKCRGLVRIGYNAELTTQLFGEPGAPPVVINGVVSAIRGHDPADEQWNVIIRCDNQGPTGRLLPLNYHFDFDATEITLTP
ncbi:HlyD family efflux transporter periplasmic adaptor subunit [Devosia sp. 919]|uniref:HlyD family efflux transporter periplasmic adaptor subunit n=1 Tax=Devosia sp. 919 TaxID=2726065 RepID=UPI0015544E95|nr:HlyD family efflux transporter periplasmic adaptor subunit [Devosia sp. 919]